MSLPLTVAISDYDHIRDMNEGRVVPEGIRLKFLSLPNSHRGDIFRFIHHRE